MKNINSKINSDTKLVLASWNIHGKIGNAANLEQLRNDLKMKKIDIGCLQETYHDEDICLSESDGHLIFVRGKEEESHHNYGQGYWNFVINMMVSTCLFIFIILNDYCIL